MNPGIGLQPLEEYVMTKPDSKESIDGHQIVSEVEWIAARQELLKREKELTHARDEINKQRRELPWVRVEKNYVFEGPDGNETLADLFDGNSQLIVYHFMFAPGWQEGCVACSFLSDHIDGANLHLMHHDVSLVVVSRAPYSEFQTFKERMGWRFKWVSSFGSDFNYDYHASYTSEELDRGDVFHNYKTQKLTTEDQTGTSVFYKNELGIVFHTYSSYERGGDLLLGAHNYLDLTPKGRNEVGGWWQFHDNYGAGRASK
jgi:predicted dithiol-disulfide oxidoreductase (DUF899 family)